ncbi:hypothetical protein C5167_029396 [Papaver somniferum]|nr:hypothetical protein C5167_029396 [Papaver somniferum]
MVVLLVLSIDTFSGLSEERVTPSDYGDGFLYSGFKDADPSWRSNGAAYITSNGLLRLTSNSDGTYRIGQAFYSRQLRFKNMQSNSSTKGNNSSTGGSVFSFSTSFILSIVPEIPGLFNSTNNGRPTNHILAVELDTIYNTDFDDINGEHVGIDINDLKSIRPEPSGYYTDNNRVFNNLSLISGDPIQVWIEYDGVNTSFVQTSHYILGWSFMINGTALPIKLSQLPELPAKEQKSKITKFLGVELPIIIPVLALTFTVGILSIIGIIRNSKLAEVVEDWELNYGRLRFSYKDLHIATKGFKEKELLGIGGFGKVYKGVLPTSKVRVAGKKISHNSKQGVQEFIWEIISIGHLRHRNLAHLLGYCRRNRELLLVYEYMPNRSLDKLIFRKSNSTSASPSLYWNQRFQIIKGVACALIYLHEDWEQVVVHRDIKASNVLLDGEMNARLGDFGLARLYDHGTNPETTNVAGTFGYITPEMIRTGKATTSSDVYAFGALLHEVACGRRPTQLHKSDSDEGEILVDWVLSCWRRGAILQTSDPNLGNEYIKEEMELVLKLGWLCSHNDAKSRPSMRKVKLLSSRDVYHFIVASAKLSLLSS